MMRNVIQDLILSLFNLEKVIEKFTGYISNLISE